MQQSFLLRKVFYLFHPLNRSCENRPVGGAKTFPSPLAFAEGLLFFQIIIPRDYFNRE